MPFEIRKVAGRFCVFTAGTDQNHGCHDTEEEARQQQKALYANAGPEARKERTWTDYGWMVYPGGSVKALGEEGKVGGHLVKFHYTDASFMRDRFTPETDFGADEWPIRSPIYERHGFGAAGCKRLGWATLTKDNEGVAIDGRLNLADPDGARLWAAVKTNRYGWTSGTALHLTEREPTPEGHRILTWPLGLDASLTPDPAEPNCRALPIKEYLEGEAAPPGAMPAGAVLAAFLKEASPEQVAEIFADLGYTGGLETLIAFCGAWQGHASSFNASCTKEGRVLSRSKRDLLSQWLEKVSALRDELHALYTETDPTPVPAAVPTGEALSTEAPGRALQREALRIQAQALLTLGGA